MGKLSELAKRCEEADPDSHLLGDLMEAIYAARHEWSGDWVGLDYPRSVDAALTLIPPGWAWMVGCAMGEGFFADMMITEEIDLSGEASGRASTPALALCAAAIRARALPNPDTEGATS